MQTHSLITMAAAAKLQPVHDQVDHIQQDPYAGPSSIANAIKFKKYKSIPDDAYFIMIGCGSIGQGTLPLLFRHFKITPKHVVVITADERGRDVAKEFGVSFTINPLYAHNYQDILQPYMVNGGFLINVSVDVSSLSLIELCHQHGVLYIDTCTEPWGGTYNNSSLSESARSNYALRLEVLEQRERLRGGATAVITHGANPGMVSHLVKQALLNIARDTEFIVQKLPSSRQEWGQLARDLGIKVIHIAERDTQLATIAAAKQTHEFVNTWSCDGFISEGCYQPSELGWGTHEKEFPADAAKHPEQKDGCEPPSIYLTKPGGVIRIRSWTPDYGPYHGHIVTHAEAISIADYFSLSEQGATVYRPTVLYAYHPCDYAVMSIHEMAGKGMVEQKTKRVLRAHEIVSGMDELGVLLMGHKRGAYWYGSQLTNDEARKVAPHQNATGMQVIGPLVAAVIWSLEHPDRGIVEPDDMDFDRVLDVSRPYLGTIVGKYTDWTPLTTRGPMCYDPFDGSDPWQFKNFRVFG